MKGGQYPSETKVTAVYSGSLYIRQILKRAYFQACISKAALQQDPPELHPLEFGWASEGPSGAHCPVSLQSRVAFAPSDILKLINCSCVSDRPCYSQRCSCASVQLPCSLFSSTCGNPKMVSLVQETGHDLDTDCDTSCGNSVTDVSDSDDC